MRLLRLFFREFSWGLAVASVLVGTAAGVASAALMALISNRVSGAGATAGTVWLFAGLASLDLLATFLASILSIGLAQQTAYRLRMSLCRRILDTPLRSLEKAGTHRVIAALTDDIPNIGGALMSIPQFCVSVTVVLGCLAYLVWLSPKAFPVLLLLIGLGLGSYLFMRRAAVPRRKRAREEWDTLVGHFRAMTEGSKELKLHRSRRETFFEELLRASAESLKKYNASTHRVFAFISSWQQVLYFVVIGFILFALPHVYGEMDSRVMTGYALAVLYMRGPLMGIVGIVPSFMNANVALQKVEALGVSLTVAEGERPAAAPVNPRWQTLELAGVTHTYYREKEESNFVLGPVDLSVRRGELLFIVGGNGGGKTTLAKLITGLYAPESGELRLDGVPVTEENRDLYRQYFSAVFVDFYLFEKMLGLLDDGLDAAARKHIEQLHLDHKVRIEGGRLSTTELSHGQRKRLALLTAYLENRPIYLFDEWASGQDPVFKEVFYRRLLPELKAMGKTVLVVSHDDAYFDVADRVVKLEDGRVEHVSEVNHAGAAEFEAARGPAL